MHCNNAHWKEEKKTKMKAASSDERALAVHMRWGMPLLGLLYCRMLSQTGPHDHDKKGRCIQQSQFNKWFIDINNNVRGNIN